MTDLDETGKRGITVCYELFKGRSPEDESDIVDADERGVEEFIEMDRLDEVIDHIRGAGALENSASEFHEGIWYRTVDALKNYQTGDSTFYSLHLKGFSPEEQKIVFDAAHMPGWDELDASFVVSRLEDIRKDYEIKNGRIVSPGKFESCPVLIAYLHTCDDWSPLESVDVDGTELSVFKITPEEQVLMQIPEDQKYVATWETDDGFAHGRTMTEEEYTSFPKQPLSAIGGM